MTEEVYVCRECGKDKTKKELHHSTVLSSPICSDCSKEKARSSNKKKEATAKVKTKEGITRAFGKSGDLTIKQARFAREYVANGGNASQAAIAAGYDNKNPEQIGCKLMANEKVLREIEVHEREHMEAAGVTTQKLVKMLLDEAQFFGEGATQSGRIQALKQLCDFTGGFDANKQKVEHSGGIDLSGKSDDELAVMLESLEGW